MAKSNDLVVSKHCSRIVTIILGVKRNAVVRALGLLCHKEMKRAAMKSLHSSGSVRKLFMRAGIPSAYQERNRTHSKALRCVLLQGVIIQQQINMHSRILNLQTRGVTWFEDHSWNYVIPSLLQIFLVLVQNIL